MRNNRLIGLVLMTCMTMPVCFADPTIINNNNGSSQAPQTSPCPPANQNNIYDPRIPPAGVYESQNPDGSYSTTYTTGEKKPYIVDNNCNNGSTTQPYVVAPVPGPMPGPKH